MQLPFESTMVLASHPCIKYYQFSVQMFPIAMNRYAIILLEQVSNQGMKSAGLTAFLYRHPIWRGCGFG